MQKTKIPSLVIIAVFTTITVICWIAFGVIRILTTKPTVNVPAQILSPISPTFDKNAVDKIRQTVYFDKEQEFEVLPAPSASLEASPTPSPEVSPVASPSATPGEIVI